MGFRWMVLTFVPWVVENAVNVVPAIDREKCPPSRSFCNVFFSFFRLSLSARVMWDQETVCSKKTGWRKKKNLVHGRVSKITMVWVIGRMKVLYDEFSVITLLPFKLHRVTVDEKGERKITRLLDGEGEKGEEEKVLMVAVQLVYLHNNRWVCATEWTIYS